MAGKFRDLDEFLTVEPIELPIGGKVYEFPGEVSARAGLLLQRIGSMVLTVAATEGDPAAAGAALSERDRELLSDGEEMDLRAELFGDAEADMIADGLTSAQIRHVFMTLVVWHAFSEDAAVAVWEGKAASPEPANRAERRASKATTGRSGAGASTTKRRASTSGTSRRTTSPRKPATKHKAAGG